MEEQNIFYAGGGFSMEKKKKKVLGVWIVEFKRPKTKLYGLFKEGRNLRQRVIKMYKRIGYTG